MGGVYRNSEKSHLILHLLFVFNIIMYGEVNCGKLTTRRGLTIEDICNVPGCFCKADSWTFINCTFNSTQKITLDNDLIPPTTMELYITGGEELTINTYTFNSSKSFGLLKIDGTRNVQINEHAFFKLNVLSFKLVIENTDRIVMDSHAFRNSNATISAEIRNSSYVQIKDSTFCRLLIGRFQNIIKLDLSRGAFRFENQGSIGRHGPVANLSFLNVKITVLPQDTFSSSMSEVTIKNSDIHRIDLEAFSGNEINTINIINCTIGRISEGAISVKTLILNFKISTSKITVLQSKSVMAGIRNLTIEHSRFIDIETGVTCNTIANVLITDNDIRNLNERAFLFRDWNIINFDYNIILNLHSSFLELPVTTSESQRKFTFRSNEIYNVHQGAFSFLPEIDQNDGFAFQNNSFNNTCTCDMYEWFESLVNGTNVDYIINTSFCRVIDFLSKCYQLGEGLINMQNFTDLVCGDNNITCEPYKGETKVLNSTAIMLLDDTPEPSRNGIFIVIIISVISILVIIVGAAVVLVIKGGIWLKRKGYCMHFRNMQYNPSDNSNDDEGVMVEQHNHSQETQNFEATPQDERINLPSELTPELLQALRLQLENPETEDQAREMIEKLYEMYIIDDGYGNNNRQEEETHLYEELGNLQQNNDNFQNSDLYPNGAINFLKYIEEKFNNTPEENNVVNNETKKPALVTLYSEPKDAAIHLYSELNNRLANAENNHDRSKSSLKSNSSTMAFRPLPDKPNNLQEAGPSTSNKY